MFIGLWPITMHDPIWDLGFWSFLCAVAFFPSRHLRKTNSCINFLHWWSLRLPCPQIIYKIQKVSMLPAELHTEPADPPKATCRGSGTKRSLGTTSSCLWPQDQWQIAFFVSCLVLHVSHCHISDSCHSFEFQRHKMYSFLCHSQTLPARWLMSHNLCLEFGEQPSFNELGLLSDVSPMTFH